MIFIHILRQAMAAYTAEVMMSFIFEDFADMKFHRGK